MFCSKCGRETVDGASFCAACGASLVAIQPPKKKTNLSLAAGIVEIVSGGLVLLMAIFFIVMIIVTAAEEDGPPVWFALFPLVLMVTGTLAITGGVCALKRTRWGMALTGAIVTMWPSSLLAIAALVLVALAKDEFER